jgi:hypothetical protein
MKHNYFIEVSLFFETSASARCKGFTAMLLKTEVFWYVTVCLSGYSAMITFENNSLLRDSVGIYRADFDYLAC